MIEYGTAKLCVDDVNEDGINANVVNLSTGKKRQNGEAISFTLKEEPTHPLNSFLYKNTLYMIDKQDGSYFEAIAIEFKGTK